MNPPRQTATPAFLSQDESGETQRAGVADSLDHALGALLNFQDGYITRSIERLCDSAYAALKAAGASEEELWRFQRHARGIIGWGWSPE